MQTTAYLYAPSEVRERVRVLDIEIDRMSEAQVRETLLRFAESSQPHQVVTANLQFLTEARRNRRFAQIVNEADLVVADGMPLLWMSRMKGRPILARVTGHDLLRWSASIAQERDYSMLLLGGPPGIAQDAAQRLREQFPGLRVSATHHGRFHADGTAERQEELTAMIRDLNPHFLFVALGCPKQELWIHRHMRDVGVPVCVGVGGTFEVFTGRLKRAPAWMQRCGLEWMYRLQQEPGRLWKRYVRDVPTALMAAGEAASHKLTLGRFQ